LGGIKLEKFSLYKLVI